MHLNFVKARHALCIHGILFAWMCWLARLYGFCGSMTLENCVRFIPPPELCFMQCPHLPDCHWAAGASLSWLPGLNVHHACDRPWHVSGCHVHDPFDTQHYGHDGLLLGVLRSWPSVTAPCSTPASGTAEYGWVAQEFETLVSPQTAVKQRLLRNYKAELHPRRSGQFGMVRFHRTGLM